VLGVGEVAKNSEGKGKPYKRIAPFVKKDSAVGDKENLIRQVKAKQGAPNQ